MYIYTCEYNLALSSKPLTQKTMYLKRTISITPETIANKNTAKEQRKIAVNWRKHSNKNTGSEVCIVRNGRSERD